MNNSLETDIQNYGSILEYFSEAQIDNLKDTILELNSFGVSAYAERIIDSDGKTIKFCNNKRWKELEEDKSFFKDYSEHFFVESVDNFNCKSKIITRSKDKIHNNFLQRLECEKLNNSVIVNTFHKNYINITYFMIDPLFPTNRDIILNNLATIESIRIKIQKFIIDLIISKKLCKKKFLNNKSIAQIFHSSGKNEVILIWHNSVCSFTQREYDCLKMLRNGVSNKFISQFLKISPETVKFHLNNIKSKTGIISKNGLIQMALNSRRIADF